MEGFEGVDRCQYLTCDSRNMCDVATISITVSRQAEISESGCPKKESGTEPDLEMSMSMSMSMSMLMDPMDFEG